MSSIPLPEPEPDSSTSIEEAIGSRRSRRTFAQTPIDEADVGHLLWAAQGITREDTGTTFRTAPSAGATYPLELFLEVSPDGGESIPGGLFEYSIAEHELTQVLESSLRPELVEAALHQDVVEEAPATIVVAAAFERTVSEYPEHGRRYVHMEAGHVAQNVQLVCESQGLSCCPVGAFSDEELRSVLDLPEDLDPLYLLSVGKRAGETNTP